MEFRDKTAKIISTALNMVKGDKLVKYSNILMYIKDLEQEYFNGTSPLSADTIYELYKNYCDEYLAENFCAKMYYFKKFNDFKIYDEEPLKLGKKRLLELNKAIEDNDKNSKEEYEKLCLDSEYQSFLRQRYNAKKENKEGRILEVRLLDYAIDKKEGKFWGFKDNKQFAENYICEMITGKNINEIPKEVRANILKNVQDICQKIEQSKQTM